MASTSSPRPSSSSRHPPRARNRLLAALSPTDLALLQPHLRSLAVAVWHEIERPNRRIDVVFFMDAGIASVVAVQADETQVEVGLVGPEGMTGTAVVLGANQSPHSTYIQVAGEAQWIKADELRKAMRRSDSLHALLLKYVQVFMVQTTHTAIANARAQIDRRLARWILMAHDRTGDKTLPLTHEFLALMLGVRRPGVTEALQSLKRQKLIGTGRNQIVVLNRNGIEKMAGHSYGVPEKEYRRLIG
jgi:CRP-like cAMP-binding protein